MQWSGGRHARGSPCTQQHHAPRGMLVQKPVFSDYRNKYCGLPKWDVSRVTALRHVFYQAAQFNGDVSEWDVRVSRAQP